jgi:hypothetical protein
MCATGKTEIFFQLVFGGYNHKELYYMWHPCFCNIQCSGRNTTKDDKPCAMGLQLKDSTTKDHTNVTKVDVHKPAQQDSPDADPSK